MFRIDITIFLAAGLIAAVVLFGLAWIQDLWADAAEAVGNDMTAERCFYCGHVFQNDVKKRILRCPVCQSYLENGFL